MLKFILFSATLSSVFLLSSFTKKKPMRIIFFGDSITEAAIWPGGYIAQLRDSLAARPGKYDYELIGAGIGGNKVYDLYLRLEKDVLDKKPDAVVIFVGVNDVWHKRTFGTGTDAPKFEQFYAALIEKMQAQGIQVIACTPACIGEKCNAANPMDAELDAYSDLIRQTARRYGCPCCDFRQAFSSQFQANRFALDCGLLTTDGVHLNDAGNCLLAEMLLPQILKLEKKTKR